jgi:hypothetical protein
MISRQILFPTQLQSCTITDSLNSIPNNTTVNSNNSRFSLHNIILFKYLHKSNSIKIIFTITNSNNLSRSLTRRPILKVLIKISNTNNHQIAIENSFKLCKANILCRITTFNINNKYSSNNHLHLNKNNLISSHNTITWRQAKPCIRGRDLRESL